MSIFIYYVISGTVHGLLWNLQVRGFVGRVPSANYILIGVYFDKIFWHLKFDRLATGSPILVRWLH